MSRSQQTKLKFTSGRDYLIPSHPATAVWRDRMITLLEPYRESATALLRDRGCLLGSEELEDCPLRHVPASKDEMAKLLRDCQSDF